MGQAARRGAAKRHGAEYVNGRRADRYEPAHRSGLAYWRAFYADQARLIWEWRATRLALLRRAALMYLATTAAILIVAGFSSTLKLNGLGAALLGALILSVLNAIARPILLLVLSPLPTFVVQVVGWLVAVVIVLVIGRVVPGVEVGSLQAAIVDAIAISALNALFAEILRASDDDSYHGTQVRRLAGRAFGKPSPGDPGLLMIQIDGLSLPVLENQMRSGRMATLGRMVRDGDLVVDPWHPLLPPVTPVSQAGILHGSNDDMPGFRWFEKASRTLIVANTPEGASEIVRRHSDGHGLLADDGVSIGNLVTGDAPRSYLTMATIASEPPNADDPRRLRGVFVSQVNYIRLAVLTAGEVLKELYQRERQRGRAVEPRLDRNMHYAFERALTNVSLRNLATALAIEELFHGAPAIYIDYTGYDALAHHVGPERAEAVDALDGLDRTIASLLRAIRETPRAYRVVILSDHGQDLSTPFSQRYGERLEDVARRLVGDRPGAGPTRPLHEYEGTGRVILGELGRGHGLRPAMVRRVVGLRKAAAEAVDEEQALLSCASGNLALLYLTRLDGRIAREEIDRRYPELIPGLLAHPGVALIVVRSEALGPVALGPSGQHVLATGQVMGEDPLAPFGQRAAGSLRRLAGFGNSGDLIVIGPYDADTGEVVSYEDLVGSHGGLGGWQMRPFLAHPPELVIRDAPLVGAASVHDELERWLGRAEEPEAHGSSSTREGPASPITAPPDRSDDKVPVTSAAASAAAAEPGR